MYKVFRYTIKQFKLSKYLLKMNYIESVEEGDQFKILNVEFLMVNGELNLCEKNNSKFNTKNSAFQKPTTYRRT